MLVNKWVAKIYCGTTLSTEQIRHRCSLPDIKEPVCKSCYKRYNAWEETPQTSQSTQESDTKPSPGSTKHERLLNKLPGLSTGRIKISILII